MSIFIAPSLLKWLEKLILLRLDLRLNIYLEGDSLVLRNPCATSKIIFDNLCGQFWIQDGTPSFCECDVIYEQYLMTKNLPAPGLARPIVPLIMSQEQNVYIHYDILGLAFWMLNRIEEVCTSFSDTHNRFPASASHAVKHNYLSRPVVDEWLAVLNQVINRTWERSEVSSSLHRVKPSHDVDNPAKFTNRKYLQTVKRLVFACSNKEVSLKEGLHIYKNRNKLITDYDPYNTYEWIMKESERIGVTSTFYFKCGWTHSMRDVKYYINSPPMIKLLKKIMSRGHIIGIHPSYRTYDNYKLLKREVSVFKKILERLHIEQEHMPARMHYLRVKVPETINMLNDLGITHDSSMCYAERPGFRSGTCHDYPFYDLIHNRNSKIIIQPLIAMECSVIFEKYMNYGVTKDALDVFLMLKEQCRKVGGSFTLLWHNHLLSQEPERKLYQQILKS